MDQIPSLVASGDLSRLHDLLGSLEPGDSLLYQQEILWLAAKEGRIEVLQWLKREGCRIEFDPATAAYGQLQVMHWLK